MVELCVLRKSPFVGSFTLLRPAMKHFPQLPGGGAVELSLLSLKHHTMLILLCADGLY